MNMRSHFSSANQIFDIDLKDKSFLDRISEVGIDERNNTWIGFHDSVEIAYPPQSFKEIQSALNRTRKDLVTIKPNPLEGRKNHSWLVDPARIIFGWENNGRTTIRTADGFGELATNHPIAELQRILGEKRFLTFDTYSPANPTLDDAPRVIVAKSSVTGWAMLENDIASIAIHNKAAGTISYIAIQHININMMGTFFGKEKLPIDGYALDLRPTP